jgi:hypothetical protein
MQHSADGHVRERQRQIPPAVAGQCRASPFIYPCLPVILVYRFSAEPFHRGRAGFIHTIETCLGVAVARQ